MKPKIKRYEYWPYWLFYAPFVPYWFWNSIKSGSFSYFCKVNPGITFGGFLDYSKSEILKQVPAEFKPKTLFIKHKNDLNEFPEFPFIVKPDKGERGRNVELVRNLEEWEKYPLTEYLIIQEFVDFEFEFGVFFANPPGSEKGKILSITGKEFLIFKADGETCLKDFVSSNPRVAGRKEYLKKKFHSIWDQKLEKGTEILLEPIGNHNRGTRFFDASGLISDELEAAVSRIAAQIQGFNYGRFDVRAKSIKDFISGKFMVLEVNGANSEPTHIYDSKFNLFEAYREVRRHFDFQYQISKKNPRTHSPLRFYTAVLNRMF